MPYLGISGQEFYKSFVIFEISTQEIFKLQILVRKLKCLNLGPKMPELRISGQEFQKPIVIFEMSTSNLS